MAKVRQELEGSLTYEEALQRLKRGAYTPNVYCYLGLETKVKLLNRKADVSDKSAVVAWRAKHAVFCCYDRIDEHGKEWKLTRKYYGRFLIISYDISFHKKQKMIKATFISLNLFLFCNIHCVSQLSEFNQPWRDTSTAIIIDPYYANKINWELLSLDHRVVAIIHKATQGLQIDPAYKIRREKAKARGYKWGSYHLGKPGDPVQQADFYLKTTEINNDEVLAIDLEGLDSLIFMSLFNASKFIARVFEKTRRFPFLYCNKQVLDEINKKYDSTSIFSSCPLWYARLRSNIPFFSKKIWNSYTLWQFSCELNCKQTGKCLYNIAGTKFDMDINVYNGTKEDLLLKWPVFSGLPHFETTSFTSNADVIPVADTLMNFYSYLKIDTSAISFDAFRYGVIGYTKLLAQKKIKNQRLCIVDFTRPSYLKRYILIDMINNKLIFQSYMTHGKKSVPFDSIGKPINNANPVFFSNQNESLKSSLGFFVGLDDSTKSKHGYALQLRGIDKPFNSLAYKRQIKVHTAWYIEESFIKSQKQEGAGKSHGCFVISSKELSQFIKNIRFGGCLFSYYSDAEFISFLNSNYVQ